MTTSFLSILAALSATFSYLFKSNPTKQPSFTFSHGLVHSAAKFTVSL